MYIDSSFEKWFARGTVPPTIHSILQGIGADHNSILPPIGEMQQKQTVDFYSVLAKEVRSPLSIINLSVEMLRTHPPAQDSAIYLDIIARNSHRITKMINEMFLSHRENTQPLSSPAPSKSMSKASSMMK